MNNPYHIAIEGSIGVGKTSLSKLLGERLDGKLILEEFEEWSKEKKIEMETSSREEIIFPGRILILKDHVFRRKDPAIVGVRVIGGKVQLGQYLMKNDPEFE